MSLLGYPLAAVPLEIVLYDRHHLATALWIWKRNQHVAKMAAPLSVRFVLHTTHQHKTSLLEITIIYMNAWWAFLPLEIIRFFFRFGHRLLLVTVDLDITYSGGPTVWVLIKIDSTWINGSDSSTSLCLLVKPDVYTTSKLCRPKISHNC